MFKMNWYHKAIENKYFRKYLLYSEKYFLYSEKVMLIIANEL